MSDTLTVAVLGTGLMGAAMARNLSAAGHEVRAWNRTFSRAQPLASDGVIVTDDPALAVRDADAVVTMLLDGPAVLDVMRTVAPALRDGVVWAQTSTVGPDALHELGALAAEIGALFLDAPVLGSRPVAESGQLTVLAAGPPAARPVAEQVFDAIGRTTLWLGDDGTAGPATDLKLVLNTWVLAVTHGAAEVMSLAKGLGVDPDNIFAALAGGPLDLPYLHAKSDVIRSGDFTPDFTVEAAAKDNRLILAAAEKHALRLDVAAAGAERFRRATAQGHADDDMAASYFASFDG